MVICAFVANQANVAILHFCCEFSFVAIMHFWALLAKIWCWGALKHFNGPGLCAMCILKNFPFCSTIGFANLRSRHQPLLAFKAMHLMMQLLFDLILVLLVLPILRSGGQSSHVHQLANIYGGEGGIRFSFIWHSHSRNDLQRVLCFAELSGFSSDFLHFPRLHNSFSPTNKIRG